MGGGRKCGRDGESGKESREFKKVEVVEGLTMITAAKEKQGAERGGREETRT